MKNGLVCIGEALIDFIPLEKGRELKDVPQFERAAGGAPANVAAAVAKLSGKSTMVTKLGTDAFGDTIVETLQKAGVDTSHILRTNEANTALAFVSLSKDGNRTFSFYRNPSADLLLSPQELSEELLQNCAVLHYGSVDLVESPMKQAHRAAIQIARESGAVVSFDPNVRLPLWQNPEDCRNAILEFLPYADIVKVSDEELFFIFGTDDPKTVAKRLFADSCKVFLYTKGAKGAELYTKEFMVESPCVEVPVFDTTGAGDSFIAAFLYRLLEKGAAQKTLLMLSLEECQSMADFASAYAAYTTMGKGAIDAMATQEQIETFLRG